MRKDKGGSAFYILYFVGIMLIYGAIQLFIVSEFRAADTNTAYGETYKEVSQAISKETAVTQYLSERVQTSLDESRKEFTGTLGLDSSSFVEERASCFYDTLALWYDERDKGFGKEESSDEVGVDKNKQDESFLQEIGEETDEEVLCLPKFSEEIKAQFETSFKEKLKKVSKDIDDIIGSSKESAVSVSFDEKSSEYAIEIQTDLSLSSQRSSFGHKVLYKTSYDLGSYTSLLQVVSSSLPLFMDRASAQVPLCTDERLTCLVQTFSSLLNEQDSSLLTQYSLKFENLKLSGDEAKEYLGLKMIFTNKKTGKEDLVFGAIFKDKIPYGLQAFDLEQSSELNGLVYVKIKNVDDVKDKALSYIVLYSYQAFFNPSLYGSDRLTELMTLLREGRVPEEFKETGVVNPYAHLISDSTLDINALLVPLENIVQENGESEVQVPIFQIYNHQTQAMQRLMTGAKVYVSVFLVDQKYNYYVENVQAAFKDINLEAVQGPDPLESAELEGNIEQSKEAVALKIPSTYSDESLPLSRTFFDVYVYKTGFEDFDQCLGLPSQCSFSRFDSSVLGKEVYLSSSQAQIDAKASSYSVTKLLSYSLSEGTHEVMIVPVYDEKGYFERQVLRKKIKAIGGGTSLSYSLVEENDVKVPFRSSVTVVDNKPFDMNQVSVGGIVSTGTALYLNWNCAVAGSYVLGVSYYVDGNTISEDLGLQNTLQASVGSSVQFNPLVVLKDGNTGEILGTKTLSPVPSYP